MASFGFPEMLLHPAFCRLDAVADRAVAFLDRQSCMGGALAIMRLSQQSPILRKLRRQATFW